MPSRGEAASIPTGCQPQRAAPLGIPNLLLAPSRAALLALCFFLFFLMQMPCKSCPPEGTCGERERGRGASRLVHSSPLPRPQSTTGISHMNIITSVPYGLIYILLQVKLIRLRNMLKIPQSVLELSKHLSLLPHSCDCQCF